ncbi:hypothetical protein P280DRAFT_18615 [Massarina eburnea CBS 473.64]|uniref:Secreted protein n=1 Tax=Massarina eburnea CBS 473.64 TaxID=1395130 RepID=A0A6A6SK49_9PLEO|nr:hypothetical protein P280DRAFT_18615 [Massarina eburnea CBS 473.64]
MLILLLHSLLVTSFSTLAVVDCQIAIEADARLREKFKDGPSFETSKLAVKPLMLRNNQCNATEFQECLLLRISIYFYNSQTAVSRIS